MHFGTEQELEQGTATGDIAAGDPPSDLASSVPALILPALILPTPDGPDPPSDITSSVPALSLPTPDGPALSNRTPDGSPLSDDHFLGADSAYPISVLTASEYLSDVVVTATLQSQPDPVFSAPLSSPAQLHCDVDPVSALAHFCSTPSPVPSLSISPAPTLDATASPAPQELVVAETVERLSAVAQQKGLAFDISTLPQFVQLFALN